MAALYDAGWAPLRVAGRGRRARRHHRPPRRHVGGAGPPRRAGHGAVRAPRDPRARAGRPRPDGRSSPRPCPAFLAGRELWAQGFSEPDAGSDLASLRTTAVRDGDGFVIDGRKIWTSWARYATWCLVLARTGTREARHRGLTAFIVDLRSPGVEVSPIEQANGTDELAEVVFDDVHVPADRIVGELGGGWAVAMHILSHERGTFAWFRHCFLYQQLLETAAEHDDRAATTGTSARPCSTSPRSPRPATPG